SSWGSRRFSHVANKSSVDRRCFLRAGCIAGMRPTCPEYMSPCPKPFDVATWCGDTNCQLDMQPAQCAEFLGRRARRGQKLSIPISRFYASLDAYDLKLSLSSAGCSGVAVAPE